MREGPVMRPVIWLGPDERAECKRYEAAVNSRVGDDNYTGLVTPERWFVGRCGEMAVRKWAIDLGLAFKETVNDQGLPDEQDFIFYLENGDEYTINVKNTHHLRGRYLMQPAAQFDEHKQDGYIGVNGADDGVRVGLQLWGMCPRYMFADQCETVMRKIQTMQMRLLALPYSMDQFASKIRKIQ